MILMVSGNVTSVTHFQLEEPVNVRSEILQTLIVLNVTGKTTVTKTVTAAKRNMTVFRRFQQLQQSTTENFSTIIKKYIEYFP